MKKLLIVLAAMAVLAANPAWAKKAKPAEPPPPPVPAWSWNGFYIGGNLGYGWGNVHADTTLNNFGGVGGGAPLLQNSSSARPSGVLGGAQIGYNWQFAPVWLAGLEADWQATGQNKSFSVVDPYVDFPGSGTGTANIQAKLPWFGTVRGRLGYVAGNLMYYATGGFAYARESASGTSADNGVFFGAYGATGPLGSSRTATGWTLGGGVEGLLANKWTWKLEYLYVDLGAFNFTSPGPFPAFSTVSGHVNFNDNILRLGVNYHLN